MLGTLLAPTAFKAECPGVPEWAALYVKVEQPLG